MRSPVTLPRNIAEPRLGKVRILNVRQPGNVWKRPAHHRANRRPSCRQAVACQVIQQTRSAHVVSPTRHLLHIVITRKIEAAPAQLQIQADNYRRRRHFTFLLSVVAGVAVMGINEIRVAGRKSTSWMGPSTFLPLCSQWDTSAQSLVSVVEMFVDKERKVQ